MNSTRVPLQPVLIFALAVACLACGKQQREPAGDSQGAPPTAQDASEIEGRVTLGGGSSDSGGIQVYIPGGSAMAMTDEDGGFLLRGLPAGTHTVMAQKFGYQTGKLGRVEIPENAPPKRYVLAEASLVLAADGTGGGGGQYGSIRGSIALGPDISLPDGAELSDCRVELDETGMKTVVEGDGSFFIWNVRAGDYTLIARVPGFPDYRVPVKVASSDEPASVEIVLSEDESELEPREITGNVELIGLDGEPDTKFDGVVITLRELPGRRISARPDGTFQIGSLARRIYTIQASAEGYQPGVEETLDLTDIATAEVTLTLFQSEPGADKPGSVSGRAFFDDGAKTSHAGIQVAVAGRSFSATTNALGEYSIQGIPPGIYELIAQAEGHAPAEAVEVEVLANEDTQIEDLLLTPIRDYPVVLSSDPPDGADEFLIRYEMPVMIRFSKKMDAVSVKESITVAPEAPVSLFMGREHKLSDYDLLVVVIDGSNQAVPVRYGEQYRLTIRDGALDAEGLALQEPFTLDFRTSKPGVMDTRPEQGAKQASVNSSNPVYIRFNARLDHGSIDARDIRIKPGVTGVPTVNYYDDSKTGWTTIEIQSQWRADTPYEVTLPRRIKTASGQSLTNTPYKLEFRTAEDLPVSVPGTRSGALQAPRVAEPR